MSGNQGLELGFLGAQGYRKGATRRRAQRTEACVLLGGEVVWSPALS